MRERVNLLFAQAKELENAWQSWGTAAPCSACSKPESRPRQDWQGAGWEVTPGDVSLLPRGADLGVSQLHQQGLPASSAGWLSCARTSCIDSHRKLCPWPYSTCVLSQSRSVWLSALDFHAPAPGKVRGSCLRSCPPLLQLLWVCVFLFILRVFE